MMQERRMGSKRFPIRQKLAGLVGNRPKESFVGPEGLAALWANVKELSERAALANLQSAVPAWASRNADPTGREEFDRECGYPDDSTLTPEWYARIYRRWALAARVVNIWPDETWAAPPEVYESDDPDPTEFETAFDAANRKCLLMHYLHRADRMSGVARYGALFLGFDDGRDLASPVRGLDGRGKPAVGRPPKNGLLYCRAFDEYSCRVLRLNGDSTDPRFGHPDAYEATFGGGIDGGIGGGMGGDSISKEVHWTRILHLADNRTTCEWAGRPRMENVVDVLYDIRKVGGASAEMFYKGGFPGYAFETYPDLAGDSAIDEESLRQTLYNYQQGLERFLATVGGTWKSLQPQVANPSHHLDAYGKLLCTTIDAPVRIFFGTESGHLASTQDDHTWRTRCKGRQKKYLDPMVLRPCVDRLILCGALPTPLAGAQEYLTEWQDLQTLSDKDRADVSLKRIQALALFKSGGVEQIFAKRLLYTLLMGFTEQQAEALVKELEASPPPKEVLPVPATPGPGADGKVVAGGGGRKGNLNKNPAGRPSGRIEGQPAA